MTARVLGVSAPIVWRPLAMTLALHAALLYALSLNWDTSRRETAKPPPAPRFIEARLVDLSASKPEPAPRAKPKPAPRPAQPAPQKAPAQAAPKPSRPKPAVPEKKPEPRPEPREESRPTAAERAEAARQELSRALAAEDERLEAASDAQVTASYQALITRVIEENWSRPPSARNDMEAELIIQLIPTGEVVSVTVARSSGLPAFDRSAVMAVQKAERFPELKDMPPRLFEQNFRRLRLKFKPEDLRY